MIETCSAAAPLNCRVKSIIVGVGILIAESECPSGSRLEEFVFCPLTVPVLERFWAKCIAPARR